MRDEAIWWAWRRSCDRRHGLVCRDPCSRGPISCSIGGRCPIGKKAGFELLAGDEGITISVDLARLLKHAYDPNHLRDGSCVRNTK